MKKKIVVICLVLLSVVSAFVVLMVGGNEGGWRNGTKERILIIPLTGAIADGGGGGFFSSGTITPAMVSGQLEKAADDDEIKAVVLRINSPGGSASSSQEIAVMVKEFEKPLIISMGDMAASGGYYISAYADGIMANPSSITGSIGVISIHQNMKGLFDMIGIEADVISSGKHKDMFSGFRSLTPEEREKFQELSDESYDQFVNAVAEGRNMEISDVLEVATGEIFLGSQALEKNLVDRLGGLEDAIDYAAELAGIEDPEPYTFPEPSFFEVFLGAAVKVPELIEKALTPGELILIDTIKNNSYPVIKYQVY